MVSFVELRDNIRKYIFANEKWITPLVRGIITLVSLFTVDFAFGYSNILKNPIIAIVLSLMCAFIPIAMSSLVVAVFTLLHISVLSADLALACLIMMGVMYAICAFYGAKHKTNIIYTPITLNLRIPFVLDVGMALFGEAGELLSVLCGGIFAFFIKAVKDNASLFLDDTVDITVMDLIANGLISNYMFYIYLASLVVMFIIIYLVRNMNVSNAWIKGLTFGLLAELVIMLAGYLFTGNISSIPLHLVGNAITYFVGIVLIYIYRDLDFSRVERVQFEDDEYYYHVTAIPKVQVAEENRVVKRVTKYRSRQGIEALKEKSKETKKGDSNWTE